MAYEFKRLSDVDFVENATDVANILIEDQGVIKRVPKATVGGNNNNSIVITIPFQTSAPEAPQAVDSSDFISGATCNKTYPEVLQMLASDEIEYGVIRVVDSDNHALVQISPIIEAYAYDNSGNVVHPLGANVLGVYFGLQDSSIFYRQAGLFTTDGVSTPSPQ